MHPCEQEQNIVHISKTLDRMERSQERVVELLEKVAAQDERINTLEDHCEIRRKNEDIIFERIRLLELQQASARPVNEESVRVAFDKLDDTIDSLEEKLNGLNRFFKVTTHKWALVFYGSTFAAIIAGTIMDIIYHMEFIKKVYDLIRG